MKPLGKVLTAAAILLAGTCLLVIPQFAASGHTANGRDAASAEPR